MLLIFFLTMFLGAFAALFIGMKFRKWIPCFVAAILFLVLAFSAFRIEVPTGGVTIVFQEVVVILVCWAGAIISTIFALVGMVSYAREALGKKDKEQQPAIGG